MKLRRHRQRKAPAVEMAPMIDMVFLLLIFYIVTSRFSPVSAVDLNEAKSNQSKSLQNSVAEVWLDSSGLLHLKGRVFDIADKETLIPFVEKEKTTWLLHADKLSPVGQVLEAMDALLEAGAESVKLATQKAES